MEIALLANTIITIAAGLAYVLTYIYMSNKFKVLERTVSTLNSTISGQSTIINDLQKYYSIITPEDIDRRISFKIENVHLEYQQKLYENAKSVSDDAINSTIRNVDKEVGGWLLSYNELSRIVLYNLQVQFEGKSETERDNFIKKHYPKSSRYFIEILNFKEDTGQIENFS